MDLMQHYLKSNGIINKASLHKAYTVTFVKQSSFNSLNMSEDK